MRVRLAGEGPLYERLYRALRAAIADGRLAPGARLPSTRQLAGELGLSRTVAVAAFAQLLAEGHVEGHLGSGTYVAARPPAPEARHRAPAAAQPPARLARYARRVVALAPHPRAGAPRRGPPLPYDFRYGRPAVKDFPQSTWAALVARRARDGSLRALDYGPPAGHPLLRAALAEQLLRARGIVTTAEHILIVNGAQQALDLVTRLVVDPGARVATEDPMYPVARQVFRAAGARVVPVAVDREGIQVDLLPRAARLAYVTPSHQFPLGGILPAERRHALVRWAARTGAYVLEDDYDCELRSGATTLAAVQSLDDHGRVIYMGSFSKVLFPALRLGYLVVPDALIAPATALKMLMDTHSPLFEQDVLAAFLREGHFERHVRRARARYAQRRAALVEAVAEHLADRVELTGVEAGVHAVAHLIDFPARSVPDLVSRAAARGVGIYPLGPHYARPPKRGALLLGYAALGEHEIRTGIRLLGEVMARS